MDNCPKCGSNWVGDKIPDDVHGRHWKREIGIDGGYMEIYDGIVAYQCPDCNEEVPVNNESWGLSLFEAYKKARKE